MGAGGGRGRPGRAMRGWNHPERWLPFRGWRCLSELLGLGAVCALLYTEVTSCTVDLNPPLRPPAGENGGQQRGSGLQNTWVCLPLVSRVHDPFPSQLRLLLPWGGLS